MKFKLENYTKEERMQFIQVIKNMTLTITGVRDYNEAIITKGGINVKDSWSIVYCRHKEFQRID